MEALCLVEEKEGNFWLNGARVAEGARRGVAECDRLGAKRWGRSNPQKLSGWRGGERERWRRLGGVEGRLAEEERLESVSAGGWRGGAGARSRRAPTTWGKGLALMTGLGRGRRKGWCGWGGRWS